MKIVNKFGGGIIGNGSGFADMDRVTGSYAVPQLDVLSAPEGVTDMLLKCLNPLNLDSIDSVFDYTSEIGRTQIKSNYELDGFNKKLRVMKSDAISKPSYDKILTLGERISAELYYHHLRSMGREVGIVNFDIESPEEFPIVAYGIQGDANIKLKKSKSRIGIIIEEMENHGECVTPGFLGVTEQNEIRALGRGGTDTTALASAYALDVNKVNLWKGTKGVRTADPGIVKNTRLIPHISYSEANNMTKSGAKIVQHKSSKLAEETGIKMRIPYIKDSSIFTVINGERRAEEPLVKYVGGNDNAKMISCSFDEFLEIREECQKQNQQDDFFILHGNYDSLRVLILNNKNNIHKGKKVGVATLVGDRLKETKGVLERASHQLRKQKINIIDYGSGGEEELYMSFIMENTLTESSIIKLHKEFIEEDPYWKSR